MASDTVTKDEIHVLMVTIAAQGHINPMLGFGKRLVAKGLHVSLATTEAAQQRMLKFTTISTTGDGATTSNGIKLLFFSDGLDPEVDRRANIDHYMDTLSTAGPINLSSLIKDHYHNKKLSCVISNPFVPWVVDVAIKHEIPCAVLWIQPCSLYSIYYHFFNHLSEFPTLTHPHNMSVEIPGLPILQTQDLPSFVLQSNPFVSITSLFAYTFRNIKKHKWVLANSFFELEKEAIEAMDNLCQVRPVGPLVPSWLLGQESSLDGEVDMWKSDDTCIDWLDKQEASSVLYISFGSLLVLSAKQIEEIAKALKNLKIPFIWVLKKPEVPSDDHRGELPPEYLEETKNQGMVVSWSPQTKVLAHPAIGCFITHCGWNSVLETITAGVPVIACPRWTDQPTNAKLVVDVFKVGLRLTLDGEGLVGHEDIEKSVEEIMFGPKSEDFKRRSIELKQAARAAVADGGSSDKNFQLFVDEVINSCPK